MRIEPKVRVRGTGIQGLYTSEGRGSDTTQGHSKTQTVGERTTLRLQFSSNVMQTAPRCQVHLRSKCDGNSTSLLQNIDHPATHPIANQAVQRAVQINSASH